MPWLALCQVVLSDHEEYLVIQALQFLSPHCRVANLQSTKSRHLRGQFMFSGLFLQRPKGLKSAFMILEGERNRRTGIPPPRRGNDDVSLSNSVQYGAL